MRMVTKLAAAALAWALAQAPHAARADAFVLIVGNNRSLRNNLPDLQYADDDAARYSQLWMTLAPQTKVHVLTELDAASSRAFPELLGDIEAPSTQALARASEEIATAVRQAKASGRPTTFTFIFAGHGDTEGTRGYLELTDGRLWSEDLEALLDRIGADEEHLIVDSCNSFFLLSPRKPGGRRWATRLDAQVSFLARHPKVGAFLSTSSEQVTYEWSDTQSGIFSHLVRSGLMGAADANNDGLISYDELQAFVDISARSVPNPEVRPRVFAQGPHGNGSGTLMDLRRAPGPRLRVDGARQRRLTLRDAQGFRLADVHAEPGYEPVLHLWGPTPMTVETLGSGPDARTATHASETDVPAAAEVRLSTLTAAHPALGRRGMSRVLRALFEEPFGPRAFAHYSEERASSPALVFGASKSDFAQLRLQLDMIARTRTDERYEALGLTAAQAGIAVALGVASLAGAIPNCTSSSCRREAQLDVAVLLGTSMAAGLWLLRPTELEHLPTELDRRLAANENQDAVLADLDARLDRMAREERARRARAVWLGPVLFGLGGAYLVWNGATRGLPTNVALGAFGVTIAARITASALTESPLERQVRSFRAERARPGTGASLEPLVAPVGGGALVGLGGRF